MIWDVRQNVSGTTGHGAAEEQTRVKNKSALFSPLLTSEVMIQISFLVMNVEGTSSPERGLWCLLLGG